MYTFNVPSYPDQKCLWLRQDILIRHCHHSMFYDLWNVIDFIVSMTFIVDVFIVIMTFIVHESYRKMDFIVDVLIVIMTFIVHESYRKMAYR